jgi:hypothetical protein
MDDDNFTVSHDGKELASVGPNVDPVVGVVGGRVACRDHFGTVVVSLIGGNEASVEALSGGHVFIRNGSLVLVDSQGKVRARLMSGDWFENEDGGELILDAASDLPGSHSAIVLNAAKRAISVRDGAGRDVFHFNGANCSDPRI